MLNLNNRPLTRNNARLCFFSSGIKPLTQIGPGNENAYSMVLKRLVLGGTIIAACLFLATCQMVDLSGPGCDRLDDGFLLSNKEQIITAYHQPRFDTAPTRDDCDVTIRSRSGTRIEYLVENIQFNECGVTITLFDNPSAYNNAIRVISCSDNSKVYRGKTRYNVMRIRVRMTTPESRAFTFSMKLKDDRGPSLEYRGDEAGYQGDALDPGIIAGIGVAGAIIIIALILLAIYLCIRARKATVKEVPGGSTVGESSVYYSGNSQVLFPSGAQRNPKGRYGSMEDIRSTTSSQDKTNGAYSNPAYTAGPREKKSERSASFGRSAGRGVANSAYSVDDADTGRGDTSWEEGEAIDRGGSQRRSRKEAFDASGGKKPLKSALKKRDPVEIEMGNVSHQPNGILKRPHSPSRSQTSSVEGSLDTNALVHGYGHGNVQHPNVHHKPVLERRRSRSGTRSHHSNSSIGRASSRERQKSSERKKPKPNNRMYNQDVFIDDSRQRRRSGSRGRTRSNSLRSKRSDRTSDSVDSESSANSISSRKVSMNPGGKRVQIKGTETDL